MKRYKSIMISVLAVLPMIYTAIAVLFILPDTVAAHYNSAGIADRYGSKYEAVILPGITLALALIYFLIRKIAKFSSSDENDRTERNLDVIDTVVIAVLVLFNVMCAFILITMKKPGIMQNKENMIFVIISAVIGVMFIVLGSIMPKTKPNSFVGMRLSFCMDTDEHWYIANRAGGIAMVLSGIATIIGGLILRSGSYIVVMLISLFVFLTVAIIYSYVKIKGEKKS